MSLLLYLSQTVAMEMAGVAFITLLQPTIYTHVPALVITKYNSVCKALTRVGNVQALYLILPCE